MVTNGVKLFLRKRKADPAVFENLVDSLGTYLEASNVAVTLKKGHVEKGQKEAVTAIHIYIDLERGKNGADA
jgi:hypothetical protein